MSARLRELIGSDYTPVVLECLLLIAALGPLRLSQLARLTNTDQTNTRGKLRRLCSWVPEGAEEARRPRAPLLARRRGPVEEGQPWVWRLSKQGKELFRAWDGRIGGQ